jgi:hypothetical protein
MGSQTQPPPFDAVAKHQQDSCYFPHLYSSSELFVNRRITASAKFCCLQGKKKLQVRNHTPTLHQKCVHRIVRFSSLENEPQDELKDCNVGRMETLQFYFPSWQ